VRYDPEARLVYVGYGDGALAVIDPAKRVKIADIKLSGHPESFQLESKGKRIFVNVPAARHVAVIDRQKREVIATWPLAEASANFPMALDEDGHRLFIGCRGPAEVLVLDTDSGGIAAKMDCCGDTDDIFYDATAKKLYVSGGAGAIDVFERQDANHYRLMTAIKTAAGARTSFYDPGGQALYLAVPHRGAQKAEIRVYREGGKSRARQPRPVLGPEE
jgi:hypothetical protein